MYFISTFRKAWEVGTMYAGQLQAVPWSYYIFFAQGCLCLIGVLFMVVLHHLQESLARVIVFCQDFSIVRNAEVGTRKFFLCPQIANPQFFFGVPQTANPQIFRMHQSATANPQIRKHWSTTISNGFRVTFLDQFFALITNIDSVLDYSYYFFTWQLKSQIGMAILGYIWRIIKLIVCTRKFSPMLEM